MDQGTVDICIQDFRRRLELAGVRVDGIALFGSAMRGTMHKDSDIDLVIISKDFENKNYHQRILMTMHAKAETVYKYGIAIDAFKVTPEEYARGMMFETRMVA